MPEVNKKHKRRRALKMKPKVFRSSDPMLSVFMWGVHQSVEQLNHVTRAQLLLPYHFKAFSKISINKKDFNEDNMPNKFKFKEYCPLVFKHLRERFEVKEEVYNQALSAAEPYYEKLETEPVKEKGHKFFYSKDNRFVVKILHSEEVEFVHSILVEYYNYAVEKGGQTLLPQYLAMYKITTKISEKRVEYHMIVMKNIFAANLRVHKKYDLKGVETRESTDKNLALKDCDFLKDQIKIRVGEEKRSTILQMLESDVNFLSQLKIMDYSLLLGVHNVAKGQEERDLELEEQSSSDDLLEDANNKDSDPPMDVEEEEEEQEEVLISNINTYLSEESVKDKEIYCAGLIDVLTKYNATKRAAHAAKTMKHGAGAEISTIKPDVYEKRFLAFMSNAFV